MNGLKLAGAIRARTIIVWHTTFLMEGFWNIFSTIARPRTRGHLLPREGSTACREYSN